MPDSLENSPPPTSQDEAPQRDASTSRWSRLQSPGLAFLSRLLFRGNLRSVKRQLKKPLSALLLLAMLGMMAAGLLPGVWINFQTDSPLNPLADATPILLLVVSLMAFATKMGVSVMELRPAELQFILAGPFSNHQILTYRLKTLSGVLIYFTLFGSAVAGPFSTTFIGSCFALFFFGLWIILLACIRGLLTPKMGEKASFAIQIASSLIITTALVSGLQSVNAQGLPLNMQNILICSSNTGVGTILTLPIRPFSGLLQATGMIDFALSLLGALGVISIAMLICYRINDGFAELAVDGIAKRVEKQRRIRGGSQARTGVSPTRASRSLPMLPYCFGTGPIAWIQISTAWRAHRRLIVALFLTAASLCLMGSLFYGDTLSQWRINKGHAALPIAMGVASYLTLLFSVVSPSGFALPPKSLFAYKASTVPPLSISVGVAIGNTWLPIAFRLPFVAVAMMVSSHSWGECLAMFSLAVIVDLAMVSALGLICVSTNLRMIPSGPPHALQGAESMLFMLFGCLCLVPTLVIAGSVGTILWFVSENLTMTLWGTSAACMTWQVAVWWLTAEVFNRREVVVSS